MYNYPDIPKDRLQEVHRAVVQSILMFCSQELNSDTLDPDQKESLLVAKQCIETTYELESSSIAGTTDLIDLFQSNNIPLPREIPEELQAEAEVFKCKGNEAMKTNDFAGAVDNYTKAIKLNCRKAIYYCNRAAAYSRLEKDQDAITDCKEAIKLDPLYGKAYGRLGIAYANLKMYQEAAAAYKKALELDPNNASYESNLRLAEEKISTAGPATPFGNIDLGGLMNNPALLNMASQMLNDPSFRNMVSGIIANPTNDPMESIMEASQHIADHIEQTNPAVLETLRQTVNRARDQGAGNGERVDSDTMADGAKPTNADDESASAD